MDLWMIVIFEIGGIIAIIVNLASRKGKQQFQHNVPKQYRYKPRAPETEEEKRITVGFDLDDIDIK